MCWKWEIESLHWQTVCFEFKKDTQHEFCRDLYLIYSIYLFLFLSCRVCAKSWSLPSVTVQKFPSLVNYFNTLNFYPQPALRSALGNRQLTCYRGSEKERQREWERRHHPWMEGIQPRICLIPTETRPGLEFHPSLARWNTNLYHHRLWFPLETHYWFLSATPPHFIIATVKMDNRKAHISM